MGLTGYKWKYGHGNVLGCGKEWMCILDLIWIWIGMDMQNDTGMVSTGIFFLMHASVLSL